MTGFFFLVTPNRITEGNPAIQLLKIRQSDLSQLPFLRRKWELQQ